MPDSGTTKPGAAGGSSYAVNTVVSPYFEPGVTATAGSVTTTPGGATSPYYSSPYGRGNSTGLVVVVPAIGVVPTQIGVSATLFTA